MYEGDGEISLTLWLYSADLTPEEMSEALRVSSDDFRRIGVKKGKTDKTWDTNVWIIRQSKRVPFGELFEALEPLMSSLLERIEFSADTFRQLSDAGSAMLTLAIESDGYPGIGIDKELLTRLGRLGITLDIDLYCDPRNEE